MKAYLFPALKLTLISIAFFVVIYGAFVFGAAYVIAPNHGRGELAFSKGKVIGFAIVGQSFTNDNYFWSRPSAVNYNAAGSAGSNKGPSNEEYLQSVKARIDTFLVHNPSIKRAQVPVELVTASGSGLDPHLSLAAARIQIPRISKARKIDQEKINRLIIKHTEAPVLGWFGPSQVNVLQLNIDLDNL